MFGQTGLPSYREISDLPSTSSTAKKDAMAPGNVLASRSSTKEARSRGHNPSKSLSMARFRADKPSDCRHRARTISHAHPSHSPKRPDDTPVTPDDSPSILRRAALGHQAPSHPQPLPTISLAEKASKANVPRDKPRDPAILYAGAKDFDVKTHEKSRTRTHKNEDGPDAEHLERNSIIEELLAKLKEFAPHIDAASQQTGVDKSADKSTGIIEESRISWEDAMHNGLRYVSGSLVREYGTQLPTAPTGRETSQAQSDSLDAIENHASPFIKVTVLLDESRHPDNQEEWPIYLRIISLSHDPPLISVDFPYGFPFPPVSSDGTFRVKIKNREDFPIGLWPDDTLLLSTMDPGHYASDDSVSAKGIRYLSSSSIRNNENSSQALLPTFTSHPRAESFPLTHLPDAKAELQRNPAAPDNKYRQQNQSYPGPAFTQCPDAQNSKNPSSLPKQHSRTAIACHQKSPSLPISALATVPEIKDEYASMQANMPIDHRNDPSQIGYKDASAQVDTSVQIWNASVPPPSQHGLSQENSTQQSTTRALGESQHVHTSSSTRGGVGLKHSQAYEKILGILSQGNKDRFETSRRVGSDGIRVLADTIWTSSDGKKFGSREEVLSELNKRPMSPDTYRSTMQHYIPRNMAKNNSNEIGGSNWRKPAPPVNKRHRQDVRNVFPDIYEDHTATSGPLPNLSHDQRPNNNENSRLPGDNGSGSAEEHDIFEHVQTLREKGKLDRLWKLKEALEKSLSDEKENLMPIRQPLQPIPGAKGFKDRACFKRPGLDHASNFQKSSRSARDARGSLNRTDDSNGTVVRREQGRSGHSSGETLVEADLDSYHYGLESWDEPLELPLCTASQRPLIVQLSPYSRIIPPVVPGGPLQIHHSVHREQLPLPQDPILDESVLLEPVYLFNPHHSSTLSYPRLENVPFHEETLTSQYQHPELYTMTPPVVDGYSLPQPQLGVNAPFPALNPIVPPGTPIFQPGNFFGPPAPQPVTWTPFGYQYHQSQPAMWCPDSSAPVMESETHVLCHRLQKEEAENVLKEFKERYPVTGKNLFKESLKHQNSLRQSKSKAKGKDAAAIQQSLEMKLLQKREKTIREMGRGRKNGVGISVRIRKPVENEKENENGQNDGGARA